MKNFNLQIFKSVKINKIIFWIFVSTCVIFIILTMMSQGTNNSTKKTSAFIYQKNTIVIDAGHGGIDGGAFACDNSEEQLYNLQIANKLKCLFATFGFHVKMTRSDSNDISDVNAQTIREKKKTDMHNRLNIVNQSENPIFISIHQNTSPYKNATGSVVYYTANCPGGKVLADAIQYNIVTNLQPENKRINVKAESNLFLLHKANCPAVLIECGFISNANDLKKIKSDEYQNKLTFLILKGTFDFINNMEKTANQVSTFVS